MIDLHRLGGAPALFAHLVSEGVLDGDCLSVTGKSLRENYAAAGPLPPGQELVATVDQPFKAFADMQVCFGNLAPEGIVFKVSSLAEPRFSGKALCFETPDQVVEAAAEQIRPGHVVVLRYQGPVGGPIAAVRDGDRISFDLKEGSIHLHLGEEELARRLAQWQRRPAPEGFDYLGFWPRVYYDDQAGCWRMLYFGSGIPLTLMGAESGDGIHWKPMDRPDIQPGGEKYAPNHLFTVEGANGGPVYIDPVARDGRPFKFYCIQRGGPAAKRAEIDETSYFHEIVKGEGTKRYLADQLVVTSSDGLHWEIDAEARWGEMPWHPDPPACCFYHKAADEHIMITRPGWGDRRVARQRSQDALSWSGLELLLQPDLLDPPQTQFYGMPVFPYGNGFVGFLWMAHFSNAEPLSRFNQLWGSIDSQLTYSPDGVHFQRGLRQPFIPLNDPGQPGSGIIYPTSMIETNDEIRIYSSSMPELHFQSTTRQFTPKGETQPSSILLHTLRKDGFTYLEPEGHWANITTKPMALQKPELSLNVLAPHGDVRFQLCDLLSNPLNGFTFEDCLPMSQVDSLRQPLQWREKTLAEMVGKVVRLQVSFRHARLYALHGDFHFADALDVALIDDGKPIDTGFMDC